MRIDGQLIRAQLEVAAGAVANLFVGRVWFDKTAEKIKVVDSGGTTRVVVSEDQTQTLTNKALSDSTTTIIDNSDNTKVAKFEASGISGSTTRTFTFPDANTTLVGHDATQTLTNKTITILDANLTIQDNSDPTKQAQFQASSISAGQTRTYTLPDVSGAMYVAGGTDVAVADGGTNISSYTAGDILYASAGTTLTKLAVGTNGQILKVASNLPSWATPTASALSTVAKNTDYTVLDADGYDVILVTTSTSTITITLPTAADNAGRRLIIKKVDASTGKVVVDGESSETIDDATTVEIAFQYDVVDITCDGTEWFYTGQHYQSFSTTAPTISNGGTSPSGLVKGVRVGRSVSLTFSLTTGSGAPTTPSFAAADVPATFRPTISLHTRHLLDDATETEYVLNVATSGVATFARYLHADAANALQLSNFPASTTFNFTISYVVY